tara:strand:- start:10575 stop:11510 length:936 start_codon:yes stop_codon:yes gene_type:complete
LRYLVTGGAGFIGSNLIKRLLVEKHSIICIDNFSSGNRLNISNFLTHPEFKLIDHDITQVIDIETDGIWHLACPASPKYYGRNPIETSKINFIGTYNLLEIARKNKCPIIFASTSEIYGNPEVHPQNEIYNGSVNTNGSRSCYKEGKRIAESLCFDYKRIHNINIKIARIFNTYGPNMMPDDGRVISNFVTSAILKKPLFVNGDGNQTRSFCYVEDLIDALILLFNSSINDPINLGNPKEEYSINQIAEKIRKKVNSNSQIQNINIQLDEPLRRKPCIKKAKLLLNWEPKYTLDIGLDYTIKYLRKIINNE